MSFCYLNRGNKMQVCRIREPGNVIEHTIRSSMWEGKQAILYLRDIFVETLRLIYLHGMRRFL
jgi:hypothetical protein